MLSVIIAVVISKPLELKLFEKEINHILLEEKESVIKTWVKQQMQQREQMLKVAISIDK